MHVRDLARGLFLGPLFAAVLIVSSGTASAAPIRPPNAPVFQFPDVPVPNFEAPNFEVPNFERPAVEVPVVQVPAVQVPQVRPPVNVPVFDAPKVAPPVYSPPARQVPAAQVPAVQVPAFQAPAPPKVFDAPTPAKSVLAPAIAKPTVTLPTSAGVNVQGKVTAAIDRAQADAFVNFEPKLPDVVGQRLPAIIDKATSPPIFNATFYDQSRKYYGSDCWKGYVLRHGKCVPKSDWHDSKYDSRHDYWYDGCDDRYWKADNAWHFTGNHCYKYPRPIPDVFVVYWPGCHCYLVTYILPSGQWCVGYYKPVYIDFVYVNVFINVGYYPTYVSTPAQAQVAQQTGNLILQTPPAEIVGGNNPSATLAASTFATTHGPLPPVALGSLLGRGIVGFGLLMLVALVTAISSRRRARLRA